MVRDGCLALHQARRSREGGLQLHLWRAACPQESVPRTGKRMTAKGGRQSGACIKRAGLNKCVLQESCSRGTFPLAGCPPLRAAPHTRLPAGARRCLSRAANTFGGSTRCTASGTPPPAAPSKRRLGSSGSAAAAGGKQARFADGKGRPPGAQLLRGAAWRTFRSSSSASGCAPALRCTSSTCRAICSHRKQGE
jgi:hypothetical protein